MGGRPGWWPGACSAGAGDVQAGVRAASEHSGRAALSPGLGLGLRADSLPDPGNPWERAAGPGHPGGFAAGPGGDAGRPPG